MAKTNVKAPKGLKPNSSDTTVEVTIPQFNNEQEEIVVATDNVPEGEPKENEDGSVIAYDENNNPIGVVSTEEINRVEESGTSIEIDTVSPLEQLKSEDSPKIEVNIPVVSDTGKKPKENVKIRLRVDHSCCIAMNYYDFKAGKVYTVPKNVKKILNRAGVLDPL